MAVRRKDFFPQPISKGPRREVYHVRLSDAEMRFANRMIKREHVKSLSDFMRRAIAVAHEKWVDYYDRPKCEFEEEEE